MLFNSFNFILLFLPVALIGFFAISRMGRAYGAAWLIVASFTFYGLWNPRFVLLLLLSIGFNFTVGELIHSSANRPTRQGALLAFGVGCDLIALAYYKYIYSLFGALDSIGMTRIHLAPLALPLGISFFTFTQIGYLVDAQQGVTRERGLLNYVLFVTFFSTSYRRADPAQPGYHATIRQAGKLPLFRGEFYGRPGNFYHRPGKEMPACRSDFRQRASRIRDSRSLDALRRMAHDS